MTLIQGIGDEVTHFFLLLFAAVVAYVAWWSTNISEQRQFRTVLLLDRRQHPNRSILRVRLPSGQLSNHTETLTISEGTSVETRTSTQSEESPDPSASTEPESLPQTSSTEPKYNIEAGTSSTSQTTLAGTSSGSSEEGQAEESIQDFDLNCVGLEESDIIETMDAGAQILLRQRRLAHFEGTSSPGVDPNNQQESPSFTPDSACISSLNNSDQNKESIENTETKTSSSEIPCTNTDGITIKLKYINDDLRVVDGRLSELLGDFKRRHFVEELNANKVVKLIFNGQVLKQDRRSLESCGLFDNCVVHCLIHQKRPSLTERDAAEDTRNDSNNAFLRNNPFVHVTNVNNNNQAIDWDLGNFLFALVSFILLAAWYFRYVYAHLYTVTATVGLIIITGVFSIVILGAYFPDNDMPNANVRVHVTRTETAEVQQQQQQH